MEKVNDSYENRIAAVNTSLEKLEGNVAQLEKFNKLNNNPEFKELILEGLLAEEVNKLTTSLAIDEHTPQSEEKVLVELRSLKLLRNHLSAKADKLSDAKIALDKEKAYKVRLMNEGR